MAPPKRKAIDILDQGDNSKLRATARARHSRARPSRARPTTIRSLSSQAPTYQPAPQARVGPPIAIGQTRSSRLQYQSHQHSAVLGPRIHPRSRRVPSRPSTTVGTWQSGAATLRRNVSSPSRTEQWTAINRPTRCPLALARDVHLGIIGHPHQPALQELTVLNAHLGSRSGGKGASPEAAQPSPAPGLVNMTPMNTFTPINRFVPINRLPNASSGKPIANTGQAAGQAVPALPRPDARQPASRLGSQHDFNTPTSETRSFSVVINSGPKSQILPHIVFSLTEDDKEDAPKSLSKSTPRHEILKEVPARKVRSKRALTPKRSGQTSANEKPAPAAAKPVAKNRGRKFKDQEGAVKEKAAKKATSKFPVPKDFNSEIPLPAAKYNVYICEWNGCPAELHNLETLRRHIHVVHNNKLPCGGRECLWADCATQPQSENPGVKRTIRVDLKESTKFDTEAQWKEHIEEEHMVPISWQMGDGPKVSPISADSLSPTKPKLPRWLCDENGIQVTPSVEGQPIEDGDIAELNRKRYKKTRIGLDIVYDPIMDPQLWWKMPEDPDYMMPRMRLS